MTTVETARPGSPHRWSRRRVVFGAAALALTLVVSAGLITWNVLRNRDREYGPPQVGPAGGVFLSRNLVVGRSPLDGMRMADTPRATAGLWTTIDNRGRHSVRITSVDTDDVVVRTEWAPYRVDNGNIQLHGPRLWHAFPTVIPVSGRILVRITIQRPSSCAGRPIRPGSGRFYTPAPTLHWESLLGSHTTRLDDTSLASYHVQVC